MPDLDTEAAASAPRIQNATDSTARPDNVMSRYAAVIPIAITLLCLLPFIRRAISMDDPLFIWMARQILKHPLDPYGFSANWYGAVQPMSEIMQNPPLNGYFIACIAGIVGFRAGALHIAFLLPAIAAALGTYFLARRFSGRPVEAALVAVLTPVFLICSSTVMCDTMMLAFWVWAVFLWVKGLSQSNHWTMTASCLLITAVALTKYYGVALIPLLLAYSFISRRRPGWWLLHFLVPIAILAAYQQWTHAMYGRGLLLAAYGYTGLCRAENVSMLFRNSLVDLGFAGGCMVSVIFLAPVLWSKRALTVWIGLAAALVVVMSAMSPWGYYALSLSGVSRWLLIAHWSLFAAGGLSLLALALKDVVDSRNADSALLFLWLAGTLVSAGFLNWTINGRSLLPMAPAAGILVMRRIERRSNQASAPSLIRPLALCAVVALAAAHADYQFANSQRLAANAIRSHYSAGRRMLFEGHWGFQYYAEPLGAEPVIYGSTVLREGDVLVVPVSNTNVQPLPPGCKGTAAAFPMSRWLATMDSILGAGFHSNIYGPVPFVFGRAMPDIYYVTPVDAADREILQDALDKASGPPHR